MKFFERIIFFLFIVDSTSSLIVLKLHVNLIQSFANFSKIYRLLYSKYDTFILILMWKGIWYKKGMRYDQK